MAQVNVSINGRQYRMACEDGQEDHLRPLAKALEERIGTLRGQFGEIGDARLMVMAAHDRRRRCDGSRARRCGSSSRRSPP